MKKKIIVVTLIIGLIGLGIIVREVQKSQEIRSNASSDIVQEEGKLVDQFPDFPVFPEAILEGSRKMPQASEGKGYMAEWQLAPDKEIKTVMQWYLKELETQGWTITQRPVDPEGYGEQVAQAEKGTMHALIQIEKERDAIEITIDFPLVYQK